MEVKIYSTPACGYCKIAKEYFKEKNIPYQGIDVFGDKEDREEMIKISGGFSVPVISIDGRVVVGWNRGRVEEYLGNKT